MRLETSRLRRVLCAVDVERAGATSLTMASLLGERFHASVDALYATAPASTIASRSKQVEHLIAEHEAQERLSGIVASVTRKVSVSSYVAPGPASAAILTHSERHTSDLIVMASSPHRRLAVAADTIAPVSEHAPCAVLTVGERYQPAPLRRILLPVGPAGAEKNACSWVTALAARFGAEVGLVRIDQPRSGLWKKVSVFDTGLTTGAGLECEQVLAALCRARVDAYEIAHPGGSDSDALSRLCETEAFDAIVFGLPAAAHGRTGGDALVAGVRQKTSAPVLSVRATRSPVLFAPSYFVPPPKAAFGGDWAQA